jgi:hypothetical protein
VSFWLEMLIGLGVITLLVVLLGPGLWSSRVDFHKPDDPKNKPPKAGK